MKRLACGIALALAMCVSAPAEAANSSKMAMFGQELVAPGAPIVAARAGCVDYRYHRLGSRCKFARCEMHEAFVIVKDPCSCCFLEVPVCVPCCCTSICSVDCRRGLFGRTVYEYCWDCGFRMEVVVLRNGDMIVHYFGIV